MVRLLKALFLTALTAATAVYAQQKIVKECGRGLAKCPSHKPCCSQYGQCGIGAYCLGGCDPLFSTTIDSCVAAPVCKNLKATFPNLNKAAADYKYLGDADKYDWVYTGKPVIWNNNLLLTMEKGTAGTVVSSTRFLWYGKIGATLKSSRGAGVVSSFILFSGVQDEIDYEWVGVDLDNVQTNYYFQGIPDYTHGGNSSIDGNSFEEYHNYEIDWSPDYVKWYVDGKLTRTLNKKDTYNKTSNTYAFPQTPSRVQLSIWPAGAESNDEGTINWAGGKIDWNSPDIQKTGYYYVAVKDVYIQCYDPPSGARKKGSKSYIYDNQSGLESSVVITDQGHKLKSMLGTGTDMDKTPDDVDENDPLATDTIETVPGNSGGGTSADDLIQQTKNGNDGGAEPDLSNGWDDIDSTPDFVQGPGYTGGAVSAPVLKGSMLAVVLAIAGLVVL